MCCLTVLEDRRPVEEVWLGPAMVPQGGPVPVLLPWLGDGFRFPTVFVCVSKFPPPVRRPVVLDLGLP